MELKVFHSPGKQWDEFASSCTDLIFYQSAWSEVLRRGLGGSPLYFSLIDQGEIVAGLPAVLLDFRLLKVLYASIPYGNLIGRQSCYPILMELLEKEFRKSGVDQVRIVASPFGGNYSPSAFRAVPAKCTVLNLKGLDRERLSGGYKKYVRRDVRKAQRSGVVIRVGTSREDVGIFHRLYLRAMQRNRAIAKYPLQWFEAIFDEAVKGHKGAFLFAELNQASIAGAVFMYSGNSTHYLHNGSDPGFLNLCPNELLLHSALEKAIEMGHGFFDFMGSDPADIPLIKFKEKWGGRSTEIQTYVKDYHPIRCGLWEIGKKLMNWNSAFGSGLLNGLRTCLPKSRRNAKEDS